MKIKVILHANNLDAILYIDESSASKDEVEQYTKLLGNSLDAKGIKHEINGSRVIVPLQKFLSGDDFKETLLLNSKKNSLKFYGKKSIELEFQAKLSRKDQDAFNTEYENPKLTEKERLEVVKKYKDYKKSSLDLIDEVIHETRVKSNLRPTKESKGE